MIILFFPKSIRRKLASNVLLYSLLDIILWLVIAMILFTVLFKFFEGVGWEEAIWQCWQTTTTVGYGNQPATTSAGRWTTIFIGTIAIAFLGSFISIMFDFKQNAGDKRRFGMVQNKFKDGYVIINYPGATELSILVQEIRAQEPNVGICIVDNDLEELPNSLLTALSNLHFVRGSLLNKQTYEMAGIKDNNVVIIFPKDSFSADSDASTKTVVDLVQNFVNGKTRVLYILVDPNNAWLFKDVNAIPILQTMELFALVQECQDPGIAQTIQRLLKNTEGAIPQTCDLSDFKGVNWGDFRRAFYGLVESEDLRLDILALVHNGESMLLPSNDEVLEADDKLQIVALERIDWEDIAKRINV